MSPLRSGRDRRRRGGWRLAALASGIIAVWLLSLGGAYRSGTAEQSAIVAQLEEELRVQGQLVHELGRRGALAELALRELREQAAAAEARAAAIDRSALEALGVLIDQRLREGLPMTELRRAVEQAGILWRCAREPERRELQPRLPKAPSPAALELAQGLVAVTAMAQPAKRGAGVRRAPPFAVDRPVEVTTSVGGAVTRTSGVLPLSWRIGEGIKEYRFTAGLLAARGVIELQLTVCERV